MSCQACFTSDLFLSVSTMLPPTTTIVIDVAVTPWYVAPSLSAPAGHGTTQGGAYLKGILILPRVRSQSGAAKAAAVPTPALRWATAAAWVAPPDPAAP